MKKALVLGAVVAGLGLASDAVAMLPTTTPVAAVKRTTRTVHRTKPLSERIAHKKSVVSEWDAVVKALGSTGLEKGYPQAYARVRSALLRNQTALGKMQSREGEGLWGGLFGPGRSTRERRTTTRTPARTARTKRSTAKALAVKKAADRSRTREAAGRRTTTARRTTSARTAADRGTKRVTTRSSRTVTSKAPSTAKPTKKAAPEKSKGIGEWVREQFGMKK